MSGIDWTRADLLEDARYLAAKLRQHRLAARLSSCSTETLRSLVAEWREKLRQREADRLERREESTAE